MADYVYKYETREITRTPGLKFSPAFTPIDKEETENALQSILAECYMQVFANVPLTDLRGRVKITLDSAKAVFKVSSLGHEVHCQFMSSISSSNFALFKQALRNRTLIIQPGDLSDR